MKFLHAIAILILITSCAFKKVMVNCLEVDGTYFVCEKP
jgi:hypothetical protein